jgi:inosine-uridine nucleoside N-ribohydrolase
MTAGAFAGRKVIIDADMGSWNDDAKATAMLVQAEDVEVLGITLCAGNGWIPGQITAAVNLLENLLGRPDIPIVAGAVEPLMGNRQPWLEAEERLWGNAEYLGAYSRPMVTELPPEAEKLHPGHAVDFIVETVKANPDEVTIFVLGPATNLALAIRKNPEIVPMVKQVIYMGGAIDIPGNTTPTAEFNWWFDPEAIKITLRAPFEEQLVVPNDIAEAVYYTKEQFDRIVVRPSTPIVELFKSQASSFESNPNRQSFVWDTLTAAVFIDPSIATRVETRYLDVDTSYGPNYGRSIGYYESRRRDFENPENFPAGTQSVQVLFDIDRDKFWDLWIDLLSKPID